MNITYIINSQVDTLTKAYSFSIMVEIRKNVTISIALKFIFNAVVFVQNSAGTSCGNYELPCDNGECISSFDWCDSNEDCSDKSDEAYCSKSSASNPEAYSNVVLKTFNRYLQVKEYSFYSVEQSYWSFKV
ncbi:UNVERIFIED_CONTAM: hypothetical protein NCL1_49829 [Trichonephila clavipes]